MANLVPQLDATDPKQAAYDALNALLNTSSHAASNPANTPAAQDAAFAVRTATSAQLAALDLGVFIGNTEELEAANKAMTPGLTQLNALKARIAAIGNALKEAATILTSIDRALTELSALMKV